MKKAVGLFLCLSAIASDAARSSPSAEATAGTTVTAAAPQAAPASAAAGMVAVAKPGQPVSNKAIELQVTDLTTSPGIGNRKPADRRQFVIVTSAWKSLIPPKPVNRKKARPPRPMRDRHPCRIPKPGCLLRR